MTEEDPLVRPLAEIVVELAWLLEDSIDEEANHGARVNTLEWVASVFNRLTDDERHRLTG